MGMGMGAWDEVGGKSCVENRLHICRATLLLSQEARGEFNANLGQVSLRLHISLISSRFLDHIHNELLPVPGHHHLPSLNSFLNMHALYKSEHGWSEHGCYSQTDHHAASVPSLALAVPHPWFLAAQTLPCHDDAHRKNFEPFRCSAQLPCVAVVAVSLCATISQAYRWSELSGMCQLLAQGRDKSCQTTQSHWRVLQVYVLYSRTRRGFNSEE